MDGLNHDCGSSTRMKSKAAVVAARNLVKPPVHGVGSVLEACTEIQKVYNSGILPIELSREESESKNLDPRPEPMSISSSKLPGCSFKSDAQTAAPIITINVGVNQSLLVWDAQDVINLQRTYRMQGASMGCYPRMPMQDTFMTLPIRLMPEEAAYLRDHGRARFVDEKRLVEMPTLEESGHFHSLRRIQYSQQVELYTDVRLRHMDLHKEELLKKNISRLRAVADAEGRQLPDDNDSLWDIIRREMLTESTEDHQIVNVELPTRSWRVTMDVAPLPEIALDFPVTRKEHVSYAAYCALKDGGFSITSGANYGADFLAFKGDPHLVYSSYMVKVTEDEHGITVDDYLRLGRVATTTKKALLWVTVFKDQRVRFCCSKWALMK